MAAPVMADYPTFGHLAGRHAYRENYPVEGAQFRAYEMASFSGGRHMADAFKDAKITGLDSLDLNDMTSSDWSSTLATSHLIMRGSRR